MAFCVEGKTFSTTPACGVNRFRKLGGLAILKYAPLGLACLFALSNNVSAQLLVASDGAIADGLGSSGNLSGNTGIVGALGDADNGSSTGSAYVFRNLDTATGTNNESVKLSASNGTTGDYFGHSVSLSGSSAIVNAPGEGSLYLFRDLDTATGTINESAKLNASDGNGFAGAASLWGNTAIVGAIDDHVNGSFSGSAYVFRDLDSATGTTTESVKLTASNAAESDVFGRSVSLWGNTAIAGAPGISLTTPLYQGSAYVFCDLDTATGSITESVRLAASDGAGYDSFGHSVCLCGNTAIVGATGDDDNGSSSGSAYVFHNLDTASGTITESVKLTASDGAEGDFFGSSVSQSGNTAIVGADRDDGYSFRSGSAYVFGDLDTATGSITESVKLTIFTGSRFGTSVSLDGDRFLVGAGRGNGVVRSSGSAHTGTVTSITTLDLGNHAAIIDSISFESRTDWIIGENTSGNHLLLSENDTAKVLSPEKAVYIGDNAGSNENRLTIAGTVYAHDVYVGDEDNSDNLLVFEDSASHFIDSIYLAEGNSLRIEGDYASHSLLDSYLGDTELFVVRDGVSERVTSSNFDGVLAINFSSLIGGTEFTVKPILLGDVNLDGEVNFLDISPLVAILSSAEFQTEADCNEDGLVNFLDIAPFTVILSGTNDN